MAAFRCCVVMKRSFRKKSMNEKVEWLVVQQRHCWIRRQDSCSRDSGFVEGRRQADSVY